MVKATRTILITHEDKEDQSKRCITTLRNRSSATNVSGTTDACVLTVKAEGRRQPPRMTMIIAAVDALAAGTCVATRATGPV